ncbi:uncharacterized protein LOC126656964 [Mercurialis annua]|uniref:uncharacterized protein LOC126656964 n=1 Tax=Mercurialis annua TaxID=3986 RepID=UPI00215ECC4E|nr:uncharacterized protein LOC126656964 [Mercurialis annua]
MAEGVPNLNESNRTINRRYVRGLGPQFDELYEHVDEHFSTLTTMARRIETEHEWSGDPIRPYYFRHEYHPDYVSTSSRTTTNPYFVQRGGRNSGRTVRGRHTGIVIREPNVPHQAPPDVRPSGEGTRGVLARAYYHIDLVVEWIAVTVLSFWT